ncbi:MAG: twin-arginine translocation signal domain-containing protein [Candidatus Methylacidiphilales bacterium]
MLTRRRFLRKVTHAAAAVAAGDMSKAQIILRWVWEGGKWVFKPWAT